MEKLSKIKLDPKDFGLYVNNLWAVFTLMNSKEQVRALFRDLFTHTEYKMFAKRLEIARRLLDGQTYGNIKKDLKVTEHTISSVSNILEREGAGFRMAYKFLLELEKDFNRKREHKQARLERRGRRKLPAETFAGELLAASFKNLDKIKNEKIARISTKKQLQV